MSDTIDVKVSEGLVRPIIESKIQAAIVQEFKKTDEILERLVSMSLSMKVDDNGNPGRGYSDDKSFMQYTVNKLIRETTQKAFIDYVEQSKPKLIALMKKKLEANFADMATEMISNMIESSRSTYNFKVNVAIDKRN